MRPHVTVVRVDPYHKTYKYWLPECIERISKIVTTLEDLDVLVQVFFARLMDKDPNVLLLVAVDEQANIKGIAAAIHSNGVTTMTQPRLDVPTENDAIKEMLDFVDTWSSSVGSTKTMLLTKRLDEKWMDRYGFKIARYILLRDNQSHTDR